LTEAPRSLWHSFLIGRRSLSTLHVEVHVSVDERCFRQESSQKLLLFLPEGADKDLFNLIFNFHPSEDEENLKRRLCRKILTLPSGFVVPRFVDVRHLQANQADPLACENPPLAE